MHTDEGAAARERKRLFEELLDASLDGLHRSARRLTGNAADAEDLVQNAVVKAYRFFDSYQRDRSFHGWMLRIMTNLYIDQYHAKKRRGEQVELPDDDFNLYEQISRHGGGASRDPADAVLAGLGAETILKAIDALPEEYRLVVTLADVEEMKYEEIAQATEVPIGTVKSRLFRARRLLQKQLWDYAQEMRLL